MATTTYTSCDCCGAEMTDTSIVNAATLMYLADSGESQVVHFGVACGCACVLVSRAAHVNHDTARAPKDNEMPVFATVHDSE